MKIEMPKEPEGDRLWTRSPESGEIREFGAHPEHDDVWINKGSGQVWKWDDLIRTYRTVYTTHPDLAALEKFPAPFSVSSAGTIRDATGKAVLDPTQQCPPCLTRFFMMAANYFAEHYAPGTTEDEKR